MKKRSEITTVLIITIPIICVVEILIANSISHLIINVIFTSLILYVFWRIFSYQFRKDGWFDLETHYINKSIGNEDFHDGRGKIQNRKYIFLVCASEDGIALKFQWYVKYGNSPIFIPWREVEQLFYRKSLNFKKQETIIAKFESRLQNELFIDVKLKSVPNIELVLPWLEEMNKNIPDRLLHSIK